LTKFKKEFIEANSTETLKGKIVLSVGLFDYADDIFITHEEKEGLDELHLAKIKMSDEVLILDVDGYIGGSIQNELDYARALSKHIRYWSREKED